MNKILDDLWYAYQAETSIKQSKEEKRILNALIDHEKILRADLGKEQLEVFKKFDDAMNQLRDICEREAFVKGIRFATLYLLDVLNGN